ncbi:MAG: carboxypeptidase regulatory-like domain-containing protein [Candidatus Micrarchaeota archaeon]
MRFALTALSLALVVWFASAATIHGIVYDSNLDPVSEAIVQVNTVPRQQMVAQNGSYSFEVPPGNYSLSAAYSAGGTVYSTEENLSVEGGGEFTLDLIFLSFAPPEEIEVEQLPEDLPQLPSPAVSPALQPRAENELLLLGAAVLFVVLVLCLAFLKIRRRPHKPTRPPPKPLAGKRLEKAVPAIPAVVVTPSQRQLLEQLAKAGGRMTQKELRKALPHASEAAVSMDLTELEDAGAVKKIKKGRGNVVKLLSPPKP